MKANYEDKIAKQTTEIAMGNLYDVNKQLIIVFFTGKCN